MLLNPFQLFTNATAFALILFSSSLVNTLIFLRFFNLYKAFKPLYFGTFARMDFALSKSQNSPEK